MDLEIRKKTVRRIMTELREMRDTASEPAVRIDLESVLAQMKLLALELGLDADGLDFFEK